jgi:hypothetical protein
MRARRLVMTALLTCSLVGLAGCGGDDDDASASGNVKKYCELSEKLSDKFDAFKADTEEELVAGMKKVVEDNKDLFDDLDKVVPDEIRADFDKAIGAIKAAAKGDTKSLQDLPDTSKMDEFDEKNCS